jgi:hypothetical protein
VISPARSSSSTALISVRGCVSAAELQTAPGVQLEHLTEVWPGADEIRHHGLLAADQRSGRRRHDSSITDNRVGATPGKHRDPVRVGLVGADEVEHELSATTFTELTNSRAGGRATVQHRVRPKFLSELAPALVAVERDHEARAQLPHQLQADVADAAHPDHHRSGPRHGKVGDPTYGVIRGDPCVRVWGDHRGLRPRG